VREIVLDTETTGFDSAGSDRIVEIGCVELVNHIPSGQNWHVYVNPERDMPQGAYEVHKLSEEFLSDKPVFADIADDFVDFIDDSRLIIHNASFDIGFLNAELVRLDRTAITMDRVFDTLALARRKHPGASNSLDALCRRYQVDSSSRTSHGALIDAELLAKVYVELIGGQQARMELSAHASTGLTSSSGTVEMPSRTQALPARLTGEEARAHRAFVDTLGSNAVWARYLKAGGGSV